MNKRTDKDGRILPAGVSFRKNENRYLYRYKLADGKTKYLYDKDLTSLKKKMQKIESELFIGVDMDLGTMTLNEWYPKYIQIFKRNKVKDTTFLNLQNYYKWYIEPYPIANIKINRLKRVQLVQHFQLLSEGGLAYGTLRSLASMLYNCMQQIVLDNGLLSNPATGLLTDIKAKEPKIREGLSQTEIEILFDFLNVEDSWQYMYLPIIAVLISTGIRWGECSGLTWSDVDFEKKLLYINKSMNYRCKDSNKHVFFMTEPKTKAAVRTIPLSEDLIKLLKIQYENQKNLRIRDDITIDGYSDFVFRTKNGYPYTNEAITATLKIIVKRINEMEREKAKEEGREEYVELRKITPHILRHTFTTQLIMKDTPYDIAKAVLGHRRIETTINIYTHLKNEQDKRIAKEINSVVNILR